MAAKGMQPIPILILYAPEKPAMKKHAESLRKAFDRRVFRVFARSAAVSHLPDIAAVKAVILGCREENDAPVHADFTEFVRAFAGVNLAGRCAAFFGEKGSQTADRFAASLEDSDISLYGEPLVLQENGFDAQKLKRWAGQFSGFIRKNIHD